jgi:hypothetical protein
VRKARLQENCKNLKTSLPTGGNKARKVKSGRNKARISARHKRWEDQHPAVGLGLAGALGSLLKVGKRTGVSEDVFDAMREWTGKGWRKNKMRLS